MAHPSISIITVVLNGENCLEQTIKSVLGQNYPAKEYVVIDGGSTDGTLNIINKYASQLTQWVSEPDRGIYDAMNKGVDLASGDWLIFMNAGDEFFDEETLMKTARYLTDDVDLVYGDAWFYGTRGRLLTCDHLKMRVIHQSLLYRKRLHEEVGRYLVGKGVTISDYIFFNALAHRHWRRVEHVIAKCDDRGVSSRSWTLYQKLAVDLLFQKRGRLGVAALLILYPFYKVLKKSALWLTRAR
ncbi:MAG TPA: glycosyltransferase family 2 protein [Syntrophorhabdales bacterium]|nr:glycosyltransferase family 2 protein [Syntrophorhabdales bacterium]